LWSRSEVNYCSEPVDSVARWHKKFADCLAKNRNQRCGKKKTPEKKPSERRMGLHTWKGLMLRPIDVHQQLR
jgi:hypothetical protein